MPRRPVELAALAEADGDRHHAGDEGEGGHEDGAQGHAPGVHRRLLAAIAPFCLRLPIADKDKSGTVSGRLSGLATTGSIIGTLGTSVVLIPAIGVKAI